MITRDVLIASTPLLAGEELRVMLSPFRGQCYLHIRKWYRAGTVMKPGKGASCRIDHLPWLLDALRTAEATALREGVLFPEDYTNADLPTPDEAA